MLKREFEVSTGIDWTTVLVALSTGLTAAGGPIWIASRQAKNERLSVRSAFLSEVAALIEIVEIRGYLQDLRKFEAALKSCDQEQLDQFNPKDFSFSVPISNEYNMVYRANLTRLGGLSSTEAKQLVRFYQLTDSVKADITEGGALFIGTVEAEAFEKAADIIETAIKIGRVLTAPAKPWWCRLNFWRRE